LEVEEGRCYGSPKNCWIFDVMLEKLKTDAVVGQLVNDNAQQLLGDAAPVAGNEDVRLALPRVHNVVGHAEISPLTRTLTKSATHEAAVCRRRGRNGAAMDGSRCTKVDRQMSERQIVSSSKFSSGWLH
jgi:hypothetical protein